MFITFEGCEASGKSTQAQRLKERLLGAGVSAIYTKEPGGTDLANKIRNIVLEEEIEDPMTEFLLISAARNDHVKYIKRCILEGNIVISDRFSDSSIAYQGYCKNLDMDFIKEVNSRILHDVTPDITFLLDIDLQQIEARIESSISHNNFYDNKSSDFHLKIKNAFLDIAKAHADRIFVIDANGTEEEVAERIYNTCMNQGIV